MIINHMKRKRTSKIWTIHKDELSRIVKCSNSLSKVLSHYGYNNTGGSFGELKKRLKSDNIDFSHIKLGSKCNKGRKFNYNLTKKEVLTTLLITNSKSGNKVVIRYIKLYDLLNYECAKCRNTGIWLKDKLVLQLDHINGINNDHSFINLRWLCPNCHSQTSTFGRRNKLG